MKYANVDGVKAEATKGAKGICRLCDSELIARCGEVYAHHWAHKGICHGDPWWENETEWHRSWKVKFPVDWQEVIQFDESGEKHIADVKTPTGWVLEFQHSYLKPEERRLRNAFYPKLVWIVDGTRRPTDIPQFNKILNESVIVSNIPHLQIRRIPYPDKCRLLKEWLNTDAIVFLDFQDAKETKPTMLWFLSPKLSNSEAFISTFPRTTFIESHNENKFDEIVKNTILPIFKELANMEKRSRQNIAYDPLRKLSGFERYVVNKQKRRRRL